MPLSEQELHRDEMFDKVYVLMGDISPIIIYFANFPLSYIFVKSQVIYRTRKADFDLQPTSVIYILCKADIIDDTEGLHILRISPYSVRMRENKDQNNSENGHFLRNDSKSKS